MGVELSLLGGFAARQDGREVSVPALAGRAVLARLALDPTRAVGRDELAGLIWSERTQDAAFTNLRQTLARLRRSIPAVVADRTSVRLVDGAVTDVARFDELLAACARHRHPRVPCPACAARRAQAAELYGGDFVDGLALPRSAAFDDWLLTVRVHLRHRFVELLDDLGDDLTTAGNHLEAAAAARRQLEREPWRESSHRRLMRALTACGDRPGALSQYRRCVQVLAEDLGIAPDPATTAVHDEIRAGTVATAPPVAWSALPRPGPLHGRAGVVETLRAALAAPGASVLGVLGLGGIGKTAVAAAVARAAEADGHVVVWRSLLNAPPPGVLLGGVLRELGGPGMRELPNGLDERLALLLDLLRARRVLLVLDNLDSVLDAVWRPGCAAYGQLLARVAAADLPSRVLVTSREQPPAECAARATWLPGLDVHGGRALLAERGLSGPVADRLVERYSGHPLALALVSRTVQELFAGDVDAYLAVDPAIFSDIRSVLDDLWSRLTPTERLALRALAVARRPLTVPDLHRRLATVPPRECVEAVDGLRRRSVIEVGEGVVGLQNVILEYVTDRIVELACAAVVDGDPRELRAHALLEPGAVEHDRQAQARLVVGVVADRLTARLGVGGARVAVTALLGRPDGAPGYVTGTLLNLAVALGADLSGSDLSGRAVWHADLRGASLPGVDLRGADLTGSAFTEPLGVIRAVAVCPTGALLAVGTDAGDVRLWHLPGGELCRVLPGPGHRVTALAFAPDGTSLVAGRFDGTMCLWDVSTGTERWTVPGDGTPAAGLAFGPDGSVLATGGSGHTVVLRDVTTGQATRTLRGPSTIVMALVFTPDGATVAAASAGVVHLWDVASGRARHHLRHPTGTVRGLACDPAGRWLAGCGDDGEFRVWDPDTGATLRTVRTGVALLWAVAASPDGTVLAVASADHVVGLWDTRSWTPLRVLHGHDGAVRSIAFAPGSDVLVSCGYDQTVRTWDVGTGECLRVMRGHAMAQLSVRFVDGGARIVTGGADGVVRTRDVADGRPGRELHGARQATMRLAVTGQWVACSGGDGEVRLWNRATGDARSLRGHRTGVSAMTVRGTVLATGDVDGAIRLWDTATGAPLAEIVGAGPYVMGLAFGRDGTLYAAGVDGRLRRWDPTGDRPPGSTEVAGGWLTCLAVAPDGGAVVVGGADGAVRVLDPVSGTVRATLEGHDPYPVALAFAPDGEVLASVASDGTARLWDLHPARCRHVLRGHRGWMYDIDISVDGRTAATAGADGTVRLWDVETGDCRATFTVDGPYARTAVAGVTGIAPAQRDALLALGAVDGPPG